MAQETRQIVDRLERELWGEGRVEIMDELYADNFTWRTPLPGYGTDRAGYGQFVRDSTTAFETLGISRQQLLVDGEHAAYIWQTRIRHVGPLLGFEATNREAEYSSASIIRVQDGRISEEWSYPDTFGLMMQLGLMPQPEMAGARR